MKAYEARLQALKVEHGLLQAESASAKANRRTRAIVAEIAALPAHTPRAVAAKCRLAKLCRETGWSLDDEFADLAQSIFDNGELLSDVPRTARPPRSNVGHSAQI